MLQEATTKGLWVTRIWSRQELRPQILALAVGLGLVAGVSVFTFLRADISDVEYWKTLGYPGVLLVSIVGSAGILLPLPGILAVCGAGGLELNLLAVSLLSGIGETSGEMSGYAIGYGGRSVIEKRAFYRKMADLMERRGSVILFLASAIPNPFFDLVGVAAGGTRFPVAQFLAWVFLGKSLKALAVAYGCSLGLKLLPWWS